jgi:hypothetical protein
MNTHYTDWGSPKDEKGKFSFSFYLASDIIQPNLKELKQNEDMMTYLKKGNLNLATHRLLETNTKQLGFFLGKDPEHTWYDDIQARFQHHIDKAHDPSTMTSLRWNAGTKDSPQTSSPIHPCQVKRSPLRLNGEETSVVMVSVGANDSRIIEEFLEKNPFSDTELVRMSWKRTAKTSFATRFGHHQLLTNNSRAVKVTGTTPTFRATMRLQARTNPAISPLIIDIAENGRTPDTGVTYVQCHEKDKDAIALWTQTQITQNMALFHNNQLPSIETSTSAGSMNGMTPDEETVPPSIFHHIQSDASYTTYKSKLPNSNRAKKSVPVHIDTNRRTFADALRRNVKSSSNISTNTETSPLASPPNTPASSLGGKTAREVELEEKLEDALDQLEQNQMFYEEKIEEIHRKNDQNLEQTKTDLRKELAVQTAKHEETEMDLRHELAVQATRSTKHEETEMDLRNELAVQATKHEETQMDLRKELAVQAATIQQIFLQLQMQHTNTSPPRKKSDTKSTPTKNMNAQSNMDTSTDSNAVEDNNSRDESSDEASWNGNLNDEADAVPTDMMVTDTTHNTTTTSHERDKSTIKTRSKGTADPTC